MVFHEFSEWGKSMLESKINELCLPTHLKVCVWQEEEKMSSRNVLPEKLYDYQFNEENLVQNHLP